MLHPAIEEIIDVLIDNPPGTVYRKDADDFFYKTWPNAECFANYYMKRRSQGVFITDVLIHELRDLGIIADFDVVNVAFNFTLAR